MHNKASNSGGGISANLYGNGNVTLVVSNCVLFNGYAPNGGGLMMAILVQSATITIENTDFVDNNGLLTSEIYLIIIKDTHSSAADVTFSMVNSTVQSEVHYAQHGVSIVGCCAMQLTNTSMRFANKRIGIALYCTSGVISNTKIQMNSYVRF